MAANKIALFGKTRRLESEIDDFLDTVSQGGILFEETLRHYIDKGPDEFFEQRQQQISDIESNGDRLVKGIVRSLYSEMLIPESRGDVLSLLQDMDYLLDQFEKICFCIDVERPEVGDVSADLRKSFQDLAHVAVAAVEDLIRSVRAFFRDFNAVRDHLHKVHLLEEEADRLSLYLKRELFRSEFPLSRKLHLRQFIDMVDGIADEAEDVADRLAIYTIKRSL
jgi:predicted phosphate transport protein (TIGR00153 family)